MNWRYGWPNHIFLFSAIFSMEGQTGDDNPDSNTASAKPKTAEHVAGVAAAAEPLSSVGSAPAVNASDTRAIGTSLLPSGAAASSERKAGDVPGTARPVKMEYEAKVGSAAGALAAQGGWVKKCVSRVQRRPLTREASSSICLLVCLCVHSADCSNRRRDNMCVVMA